MQDANKPVFVMVSEGSEANIPILFNLNSFWLVVDDIHPIVWLFRSLCNIVICARNDVVFDTSNLTLWCDFSTDGHLRSSVHFWISSAFHSPLYRVDRVWVAIQARWQCPRAWRVFPSCLIFPQGVCYFSRQRLHCPFVCVMSGGNGYAFKAWVAWWLSTRHLADGTWRTISRTDARCHLNCPCNGFGSFQVFSSICSQFGRHWLRCLAV